MNEVSLDQLTAGQFAELVHTRFQLQAQPGLAVSLELVAVSAPRSDASDSAAPRAASFECFSLQFSGPSAQPLGQGTYRFVHERLGAFDLFIVPVSADARSRHYEAVFNRRLMPPAAQSAG